MQREFNEDNSEEEDKTITETKSVKDNSKNKKTKQKNEEKTRMATRTVKHVNKNKDDYDDKDRTPPTTTTMMTGLKNEARQMTML